MIWLDQSKSHLSRGWPGYAPTLALSTPRSSLRIFAMTAFM
jgi:hypothetical protein